LFLIYQPTPANIVINQNIPWSGNKYIL